MASRRRPAPRRSPPPCRTVRGPSARRARRRPTLPRADPSGCRTTRATPTRPAPRAERRGEASLDHQITKLLLSHAVSPRRNFAGMRLHRATAFSRKRSGSVPARANSRLESSGTGMWPAVEATFTRLNPSCASGRNAWLTCTVPTAFTAMITLDGGHLGELSKAVWTSETTVCRAPARPAWPRR